MSKKAKKSKRSVPTYWQVKAKRLDREVAKFMRISEERERLLRERGEVLHQYEKELAALEVRVTSLESVNADLNKENQRLSTQLWQKSKRTQVLNTTVQKLNQEIAIRRRVSAVLASFHLAGRPIEDCFDEFGRRLDLFDYPVHVDMLDIVGAAYKSASRLIHKQVFAEAVRLDRNNGPGQSEAEAELDKSIARLEEALGVSLR